MLTVMFKIDYLGRELSMHSPDPADPSVTQRVITIESGAADRLANMGTFAARALDLLASTLAESPK